MGFKGITMNTPPTEAPHICAEDDAAIFQSIFGCDGVFNIGQKFEAAVLSNNLVRMGNGVFCVNGHIGRTAYGLYDDFEIANGQSGVNRNDLIVARFQTTGTNGTDTYTVEVKQGTAGTEAVDPEITQEDLYQGGKVREYPLYRIKIEGLSIVAVEPLFKIIPTIPELEDRLGELNSELKELSFKMTSGLTRMTSSEPGKIALPNGAIILYGYAPFEKFIEDTNVGGYTCDIDLSSYGLYSVTCSFVTPCYQNGIPNVALKISNNSNITISVNAKLAIGGVYWMVIG